MSDNKRNIIVTSALPYANGAIHLGHLVEYLQTDFWVRFQKMRGHNCVYCCADDTHGTPIMVRARKEGVKPEDLIARSWKEHTADFAAFEIEFDEYGSTNCEENHALVDRIWEAMDKAGFVSSKKVPQLYCAHDKMFLPDRFVKGTCPKCGAEDQYGDSCDKCGQTYSPEELGKPFCTICGATPETRESERLYFELEPSRNWLKEYVRTCTSEDVANKLLEWFDEPLRGWCVSRDAPYFGFEIPGHPGRYFYVWVDAPINYMATFERWCKRNGKDFESIWQNPNTEIYHFIGKDIVRFHCLFWPVMLHTAGFHAPTKVFVHGFLTVNGEKMAKSKGTFLKAAEYARKLNPQDLRFYYACKLNGTTDDLDLNIGDFVNRVNSDLVGKITNLASRGAQMLHKHFEGKMGELDEEGEKLLQGALFAGTRIAEEYEARNFGKVMVQIRGIADAANEYFDRKAPWALVKTDKPATQKVLTSILHVFRALAIYLSPILPSYSAKVAKLFGEEAPYKWDDLLKRLDNGVIAPYEYLATRIEQKNVDAMIEENRLANAAAVSAEPAPVKSDFKPTIDYDTFDKVDLRVAKVLQADAVDGADKLLRLTLDLGNGEKRNVFAGVRKHCDPATLVGGNVIVVANLAPRKMRFGVSEGMILAASNADGKLFVVQPPADAEPGAKIK